MPLTYKRKHPDFPLRRFIRDNHDIKLTGACSKGRKKKYAYYLFIQTKLQWPKIELEASFASFMDKYALDSNLLDELKKKMLAQLSGKSKNKESQSKALRSKKEEIKAKQNKLIEKNIHGIISDSLLKENPVKLDEEIWNIDKALAQSSQRPDIAEIVTFISRFLLSPSATWKTMPLDIKVKLLWFQFPEGVILDGTVFRTNKISSIFKVKELFFLKHPR